MLWLRRNGDFVATDKRGQYTVYRAGGRTFAASFRPHGTKAITRDIGVVDSIGAAKGLAERHATTAFGSRSRSRTRWVRLPASAMVPADTMVRPSTRQAALARQVLYGNRGKGNYRVVIFGKGVISGFASEARAHEWARQEMHHRVRYRVERIKRRRRA